MDGTLFQFTLTPKAFPHALARSDNKIESSASRRHVTSLSATPGARSGPFARDWKDRRRGAESCRWIWWNWRKLRFHQSSQKA